MNFFESSHMFPNYICLYDSCLYFFLSTEGADWGFFVCFWLGGVFFHSLKNQDATSSFSEGIFEMATAGIQKSQLSGQPSEMQG